MSAGLKKFGTQIFFECFQDLDLSERRIWKVQDQKFSSVSKFSIFLSAGSKKIGPNNSSSVSKFSNYSERSLRKVQAQKCLERFQVFEHFWVLGRKSSVPVFFSIVSKFSIFLSAGSEKLGPINFSSVSKLLSSSERRRRKVQVQKIFECFQVLDHSERRVRKVCA